MILPCILPRIGDDGCRSGLGDIRGTTNINTRFFVNATLQAIRQRNGGVKPLIDMFESPENVRVKQYRKWTCRACRKKGDKASNLYGITRGRRRPIPPPISLSSL